MTHAKPRRFQTMARLIASVAGSLLLTSAAMAQPASSSAGAQVNLCAGNAVGQDGKPLVGAARDSFMKKCEAENRYPRPADPTSAVCEAKAISEGGYPLTGAAKEAFVKKCVIDTRAVQ